MKTEGFFKQIAIIFGVTLVIYLASFAIIERVRESKGPWQVTFRSDANGRPSLVVNQPTLNISNVVIEVQGEKISQTSFEQVVAFDAPKKPIPFGTVIFIDTTYLPGTVTFDLFGHEIELLPRVLSVNMKEHPWKSGETIMLLPDRKIPVELRTPKKKPRGQ